jgi:hypothetical protein
MVSFPGRLILVIVVGVAGLLQADDPMTKKEGPVIPASLERLYADVKALTGINPPRNYLNIGSLNKAAEYIHTEFQKLGCDLTVQPFTVNGKEYKNIICSFGGRKEERIVVGAHYDVYGPYPGADDNASGVAGLLEIGRLLNELKPPLRKRVDLVAYSLEEPPFFRTRKMGSYVHAKSLSDANATVKVMICLESIGYFSEEPDSQHFPLFAFRWFFPDRGNFIVVVGKWGQGRPVREIRDLMSQASRIHVDSINAPSLLPGIDLSDHKNYWKFGYDAVMVTDSAFYRNPHYHEPTDTIDTLNFDYMTEVVKGVYRAVVNL